MYKFLILYRLLRKVNTGFKRVIIGRKTECLNIVWGNKNETKQGYLGILNIICSRTQTKEVGDVLRKKFWEENI